jgi:hypothetical protein
MVLFDTSMGTGTQENGQCALKIPAPKQMEEVLPEIVLPSTLAAPDRRLTSPVPELLITALRRRSRTPRLSIPRPPFPKLIASETMRLP